MNSYKELTIT